jgi:RHS repeat-associated protein
VKKVQGSATTVYVYDAGGNLAAEYATQPETPLCTTCYLTADHLGSTRLMTDGTTGLPKALHDYLPFGEEIPAGIGGRNSLYGTDSPRQRFTGKERDPETGLDYFGARYFSAAQGRWTTPDWSAKPSPVPFADLKNPQSLNLYSYVLNNPLAIRDLDGHAMDCSGENAQKVGCQAIADWNAQHGIYQDQKPLTTAGVPVGPSAQNHAAADQNPAVLQVSSAKGGIHGGEIVYDLQTAKGDTQNYVIVQAETDESRATRTPFGRGTSLSHIAGQFQDGISPGLVGSSPNSIQTFYMVPVDSNGKVTGPPRPVNVQDKQGNNFYALGVYMNPDGHRVYVNGRPVGSGTFVPPTGGSGY